MFGSFRSLFSRAHRRSQPRSFRPTLEEMEGRLTPAITLPAGFTATTVASGVANPTAMDFSPDGRLFILDQSGNVDMVRSDGSLATALHLNVDFEGERGLLGIAFDPNFAMNHFVYLYYTNANPGARPESTGVHNQLSRFTVSDTDPQNPVFTNEAPILDWDNLIAATNHNGGAIHFGADGMLYADAGDNTQTFTLNGQTFRVSQTLNDLLGKQLRIDVANFNNGTAVRDDTTVGHLIPTDNPFVGVATGVNQLIYNLGLRNPFTFAVQPGTGTIFINDVGESTFEEIDKSLPGANYGWSGGNTDGFGQTPPGPGFYQDPLLAYSHTGGPAGGGSAIVGGTFYDPATNQFPESYVGKYFYADLSNPFIRVFDPANPGTAANPDTSQAFATGLPSGSRDLKVDAQGNLYYLSGNGSIIRISYVPGQMIQTAGTFDPSTGTWLLRSSNTGGAPDVGSFQYGLGSWTPLVGDWNGDRVGTVGVFDPTTATFYLRNENSAGAADAGVFQYGLPGWIAVAGDWTHSGHTGIGVFDPTTATFYLRNSATAGVPDFVIHYGLPGWIPVVGDWNGDGASTIGVIDPSTMTWYLRNENSGGAADAGTFQYGLPGWKPVTGDFTGSGTTGIAVVDPGANWYIRSTATTGAPDVTVFSYGVGTWQPVAGHYTSLASLDAATVNLLLDTPRRAKSDDPFAPTQS
jgi:glucose/arabinose dehydrogenase